MKPRRALLPISLLAHSFRAVFAQFHPLVRTFFCDGFPLPFSPPFSNCTRAIRLSTRHETALIHSFPHFLRPSYTRVLSPPLSFSKSIPMELIPDTVCGRSRKIIFRNEESGFSKGSLLQNAGCVCRLRTSPG